MNKKLLKRIFLNKWLIASLIYALWMFFGDPNRIIDRMAEYKKMKQLEKDMEYFMVKIEEDSRRMQELRTDKDNLEKFAREQYLMKRKGEDIFVIIED